MSRFFPELTYGEQQKLKAHGIDIDNSYVRFLMQVSPTWLKKNLNRLGDVSPVFDPIDAAPGSPAEWRDWLSTSPPPCEIPLSVVFGP